MIDSQRLNTENRLRNAVRIVVMGTTGAGKTTLARQVAEAFDVPHVELDYYRFRPNWVEVPNDEFRERVRHVLQGERWVADGNYGLARDVIWPRATMLVYLDYPIYVVMCRLFWRTIGRGVLRKELWHGNKEKLWWHFFSHARFAVPVGAEDSLASSSADTVTVGVAGAWSSGVGTPAHAEGGTGVDEGASGEMMRVVREGSSQRKSNSVERQ